MKRIEAVKYAKDTLKGLFEDYESQAEWLVALSLKAKRSDIFSDVELSKQEEQTFNFALLQLKKNVPLQYIFNSADFYGYNFEVNPSVLIPRPETEELVFKALKYIDNNSSVLDIGTGSGAIAIVIYKEKKANVVGVDISKDAIKVAKKNALSSQAKVEFIVSNLFEKLEGRKFDIIISNPPYISKKDYQSLEKNVKDFEPKLALIGGEDGLDFYKRIINDAPQYLNNNGLIFFEVGIGQAKSVKELLKNNFKDIVVLKDLEGIERIVYARYKE